MVILTSHGERKSVSDVDDDCHCRCEWVRYGSFDVISLPSCKFSCAHLSLSMQTAITTATVANH